MFEGIFGQHVSATNVQLRGLHRQASRVEYFQHLREFGPIQAIHFPLEEGDGGEWFYMGWAQVAFKRPGDAYDCMQRFRMEVGKKALVVQKVEKEIDIGQTLSEGPSGFDAPRISLAAEDGVFTSGRDDWDLKPNQWSINNYVFETTVTTP